MFQNFRNRPFLPFFPGEAQIRSKIHAAISSGFQTGRFIRCSSRRSQLPRPGETSGLTDDWFNLEASAILERGLPDGAVLRSGTHAKAFGPCLTIRFLDRIDLIALKMFASLDPAMGRRHVADLVAIDPMREEILHGPRWMSAWTSSPEFKAALRNLADAFDCGDIVGELLSDRVNRR